MTDKTIPITQTRKWLSTVIIAHRLCPFAKQEFDAKRIHYVVIDATNLASQLEHIIAECVVLDKDSDIETSLLIFPQALTDFEDYLDMLNLATDLLAAQGYEATYQLASFHPNYLFADMPADDPSHYTNRSPYPMIHILREASVERVLKHYPNPEKIPKRNIKLTQNLGLKTMRDLLANSYQD